MQVKQMELNANDKFEIIHLSIVIVAFASYNSTNVLTNLNMQSIEKGFSIPIDWNVYMDL